MPERIKISVSTGYNSRSTFLLPELEPAEGERVAAILARAQSVSSKNIADQTLMVTDAASHEKVEVQIVDAEVVMTQRQYLEAAAAQRQREVVEAQRKADAAAALAAA